MRININKDGHLHSEFCPHGTNDKMELYINEAILKGLKEITFTEHMPIIESFYEDKKFLRECSPNDADIQEYFQEVENLKKRYKGTIKINIGLEVDYIEGYEEETKKIISRYEDKIDEGILSVHFLKYKSKYYPIDVIEGYEALLKECDDLEEVYDLYFETIIKSMNSMIAQEKIKRVGHPTLIRIFNKKYPLDYNNMKLINKMIDVMKSKGYECDVNTAGLRKEFCREIYPNDRILKLIINKEIPCVLGSDSHEAKYVGFGREKLQKK